ncbi:Aste57867_4567 [Aphanomyces stellatus]|uniref:Aste57867_4567 protein n=1 Tax=Aphanomyces stellatus TaxID=120398 RepID=A0A485KDA2_9STRA|nr:hypothetical protein As57867_004554 [Aphanomyces stellatus]VFT81673.1 Aste57867_4567 [Aphanomyces stellatus]
MDTPPRLSLSEISSTSMPIKKTDDKKRRKRVLTPQQRLTNRIRSMEYYEAHKDVVLQRLRFHYSENRDKERQRQREKYLRTKAKLQSASCRDDREQAVQAVAANHQHQTSPNVAAQIGQRHQMQFLLN